MFEFIEEQTDEKEYAIIANTSSYTTRFDEFTIIDGVTVTFPIDGFYTYNVYEQANGSGNLDPTGLTRVEHGRMHVYVVDTDPNEYENTTEQNTVYE